MIISNINVKNEGYVHCKSRFYTCLDGLSGQVSYDFSTGINKLVGEIDSGNWAVSYMMSMFKYDSDAFILFEEPYVNVNNNAIHLNELSEYSCYMDMSYPLFASNTSVKNLIIDGLKYSKMDDSLEDIISIFDLNTDRIERPLSAVGNEIFRAMSAIGIVNRKEIFCFPWLSAKRYEGYHNNITMLLEILNSLGKIVIVPVGE